MPGEVWCPALLFYGNVLPTQNEIDVLGHKCYEELIYPGDDVHGEPLGDQFDVNPQINLWSVWAGTLT
jgi:hypothetical protein